MVPKFFQNVYQKSGVILDTFASESSFYTEYKLYLMVL